MHLVLSGYTLQVFFSTLSSYHQYYLTDEINISSARALVVINGNSWRYRAHVLKMWTFGLGHMKIWTESKELSLSNL